MRPEDFNSLPPAPPVDPALLDRIAANVARDLRPVRPLPSGQRIVLRLLVVFLAVSVLGAAGLRFTGLLRLSAPAIALIFSALAGLALLSSAAAAAEIVPGSKRPFHPALLLAIGCAVMAGIFVLVFPDHSAGRFVPEGIVCLRAGLMMAAPAAVCAWLVLRRGFAVNRGAAGVAEGAFAGLVGLTVLELHCPNFRLLHVLVWHIAPVPIAALVLWAIYFFGSKRRAAELMQ